MNKPHALTLALFLAITAPDETRSVECSRIADELAHGMDLDQVEACKEHALALAS
jgi:hypothetical protein